MSTSRSFFILIVFFLFSPLHVFAHPVINEVYPVGSDDWVEIYNPASEPVVDLSTYVLRDSSKTNKVVLTGSLPPGGFTVFAFGNKLNNGGDTVKLLQNSDNSVVNEMSYGKGTDCVVSENQTIGRNAQGSIVVFSNPSKGQQNNDGSSCLKSKSTEDPIPTPKLTVEVKPVEEVYEILTSEPEVKAAVVEQKIEQSPSATQTVTPSVSDMEMPPSVEPSQTIGNTVVGLGVVCILVAIVGLLHVGKKRYNEKHAQEGR